MNVAMTDSIRIDILKQQRDPVRCAPDKFVSLSASILSTASLPATGARLAGILLVTHGGLMTSRSLGESLLEAKGLMYIQLPHTITPGSCRSRSQLTSGCAVSLQVQARPGLQISQVKLLRVYHVINLSYHNRTYLHHNRGCWGF